MKYVCLFILLYWLSCMSARCQHVEGDPREQSLRLLQYEQVQLRQTSFQRNVILGGTLFLLILSGLAYRGYRIKRRHVLQLKTQQQVIYRQNMVQQQLLDEKDKLLRDKDLLMHEIHHRLTNNLNIIMNLLETQSFYLNNEAAQAALSDTQNRIQAVFLVHQKLHGSAAVTDLYLPSYILEIINYLCETFDIRNYKIVITHQIDPVFLNTSEVLPIGIIVNEAITNAVKHAFPGDRKGQVHLSVRWLPTGDIKLQIRDNGVGLPSGLRHDEGKSLGFSLIKGLVNQLEGKCTIKTTGGVEITIQFRPNRLFSPPDVDQSSAVFN